MYFHHLPYLSDPLGWLFVLWGLAAIGVAVYVEYLRERHRRKQTGRSDRPVKPRRHPPGNKKSSN
jgi:hypothetical protein